jgi:hypothetical protein
MRHLETVRWFGGKGAGARDRGADPCPVHPRGAVWRCAARSRRWPTPTATPSTTTCWWPATPTRPPRARRAGHRRRRRAGRRGRRHHRPGRVAAFVAAHRARDFADAPVGVWRVSSRTPHSRWATDGCTSSSAASSPARTWTPRCWSRSPGSARPACCRPPDGPGPSGAAGPTSGMVIERVPGATDGWELATRRPAPPGRTSPPRPARARRALARGARTLADAFGVPRAPATTSPTTRWVAPARGGRWPARRSSRPHAAGLRAGVRRAARPASSPVQRVHGDFHLARPWSPPRAGRSSTSRASRPRPPQNAAPSTRPWRDVAGHAPLLRLRPLGPREPASPSRDELGRRVPRRGPRRRRPSWPTRPSTVVAAQSPRLRICWPSRLRRVDKAIYEVVYEVRNRPEWVGHPATGH